MIYLLVALLSVSTGWIWGHSTARIRIINLNTTATEDAVAAVALAAACCETWWTSAGAEHDAACATSRHEA